MSSKSNKVWILHDKIVLLDKLVYYLSLPSDLMSALYNENWNRSRDKVKKKTEYGC